MNASVRFYTELRHMRPIDEGDVAPDRFDYLKQIRRYLARKEASNRWQIVPKVVLQTFSFEKLQCGEDLGNIQTSCFACRLPKSRR